MSEYCPHCDGWDWPIDAKIAVETPPCSRPDCDGNRVRRLDWQTRAEAAEAQLAAVRAMLHKPEHLWRCGCCTAVLNALGDDA